MRQCEKAEKSYEKREKRKPRRSKSEKTTWTVGKHYVLRRQFARVWLARLAYFGKYISIW